MAPPPTVSERLEALLGNIQAFKELEAERTKVLREGNKRALYARNKRDFREINWLIDSCKEPIQGRVAWLFEGYDEKATLEVDQKLLQMARNAGDFFVDHKEFFGRDIATKFKGMVRSLREKQLAIEGPLSPTKSGFTSRLFSRKPKESGVESTTESGFTSRLFSRKPKSGFTSRLFSRKPKESGVESTTAAAKTTDGTDDDGYETEEDSDASLAFTKKPTTLTKSRGDKRWPLLSSRRYPHIPRVRKAASTVTGRAKRSGSTFATSCHSLLTGSSCCTDPEGIPGSE